MEFLSYRLFSIFSSLYALLHNELHTAFTKCDFCTLHCIVQLIVLTRHTAYSSSPRFVLPGRKSAFLHLILILVSLKNEIISVEHKFKMK